MEAVRGGATEPRDLEITVCLSLLVFLPLYLSYLLPPFLSPFFRSPPVPTVTHDPTFLVSV